MWPFKYPYSNFHELNLDWVLSEIEALKEDYKRIPSFVSAIVENIQNPNNIRNYVSVKEYGATGDGVTDDTYAIQAAIDNNPGATVFIPEGVYVVSQPINLWRSGKNSIRFGGGTIRAAAVIPAVINVGILRDGEAPLANYLTQGVSGYGVIDCNTLAAIGIDIANYAGYCHILDIQIRNAPNIGIRICTDDTLSSQCTVNNVGVYGVSGTVDSVGIECHGSDNILTNIHSYLFGTGINIRSDIVDNVHVWVKKADYTDISVTTGARIRKSVYGGLFYTDTVGTAIRADDGAIICLSTLMMISDSPIDYGIMVNADYKTIVNIGRWRISSLYTLANPLHLRNWEPAANVSGTRNFQGQPAMDNLNFIEQPNEMCNIAYNKAISQTTRNYANSMAAGWYKIGYVPVATAIIKLTVGSNNAASAEIVAKTLSNGSVSKLKVTPYNNVADEIVFGNPVGIEGRQFFPIFYHATATRTYNFLSMDAHVLGGVSGYFPIFKSSTAQYEYSAVNVDNVLTIPLNVE